MVFPLKFPTGETTITQHKVSGSTHTRTLERSCIRTREGGQRGMSREAGQAGGLQIQFGTH